MKKTLLLVATMVFTLGSFAQISIYDLDGNSVEGTQILVDGDPETEVIHFDYKVQNNSDETNTYNLRRYELEFIPGTFEYYCWSLCLTDIEAGSAPVHTFPTAAGLVTLESGAESAYGVPAFYIKPEGNSGTAIYRYVVFNTEDANDTAYVDMVYNIGTTSVDEFANFQLSEVYPNPSNDVIYLDLNMDLSQLNFEVYSLVGKRVYLDNIKEENGRIMIKVSHLNPGIYMLQERNSQTTRKFIISR